MATMILANATVSGENGYAQTITTASGHALASDEPERAAAQIRAHPRST